MRYADKNAVFCIVQEFELTIVEEEMTSVSVYLYKVDSTFPDGSGSFTVSPS